MIRLGTDFRLPDSIDLSVLNKLPVHVHTYGDPPPGKDVFQWMQYVDPNGTIAFARNLGAFMPEVATYVKEYLENILRIDVDPHRVNFMETVGDVEPHVDEGGRLCCINIGIRNSEAAYTRTEGTDYVVEVGSAYLLDVSKVHSVVSREAKARLLITYGFGVTAERVLSKLR